ncbi:Por secretion system C-terminal sorting domain-containing protein [Reichenbachiella faecimaris]|uniref:Por secretion system C-terminal sorting domain-containing protein n=1 Tax=Reichenbachiella faecimaris TaxID=692418 RepID=A0A1W2GJE6_REIFA|nr:S8 family peptidase [Reichenbachiella faecimaris]SMD36780.1 Por secretion system C-terminal sorting domain-containing protein [Reichenbachiella faecimaris]
MLRSRWLIFLLVITTSIRISVGYATSMEKYGWFYLSIDSSEKSSLLAQDSSALKKVKGLNIAVEQAVKFIPQFNNGHSKNGRDSLIEIDAQAYQTFESKKTETYSVIAGNLNEFIEYLNSLALELKIIAVHESTNALSIQCQGSLMERIVKDYMALSYVGLSPMTPKLESSINYMDLSVNRINVVHSAYPELKGETIKVSIKEQFVDTTDIDLKGRYFSSGLESEIISQHANFMATMIAGAGNTYHLGKGVASSASITSSDFTSIFPDENDLLESYDISIQNHSYGFEIDNRYSPETQAYDHQSYQMSELLHVFSAGNKGNEVSEEGVYANIEGFANLTGSQKMAKNAVVVGATDRFGVRDSRSSAGPTFDGRIKPDLMAYGQEGSSDAAALVSGASVLVQDSYWLTHGELPPSSLVKALLIAGASAYDDPISFKTGYGQLNSLTAVDIQRASQYITGAVQKNLPSVFELIIPEKTHKVRVVLCWTDPAGVAGADQALTNDLDMKIINPNDQMWLPWVLDHSPNTESLMNAPIRGIDSINNTELITIDNPEAGTYTIQVSTETLMSFPQNFSLAYQLEEENTFDWTFPKRTDICLTGKELIFRWDSNLAGTGKLELRNGEGDWMMLSEGMDLSDSQFAWISDEPFIQTQLRMTVGANSYLSDEFNIVGETELTVDYNCTDKFKLIWEKDEEAVGYELYDLSDEELALNQVTADTFLIFSKSSNPALNYAVRPLYVNSSEYNSRTIDYTQQGVNCYYKNFTAELIDDTYVENNLSLTSISDIASVDFYNWKDGIPQKIMAVKEGLEAELLIEDVNPSEGVNNYFAQINLKDGANIQTDTTSIYFTREHTLIIFPNPIAKSNFLNVLTGKPGATLQLLNTRGDLLYEEEVFFDFVQIPIADLSEGIYILRLYHGNNNNISHAKLMVTD